MRNKLSDVIYGRFDLIPLSGNDCERQSDPEYLFVMPGFFVFQ